MKRSLTMLALLSSLISHSQDSLVSCLTNWKLGDTKRYSIIHEQSTDKILTFKLAYEASVSVIDSTSKGYTIKWVYHSPKQPDMGSSAPKSLPIYEGITMIFKITRVGEFIELLNWEEVRDAYFRTMEFSLPKKMNSTALAHLQASKNLFQSREVVETALIREIQIFHVPFGYGYFRTGSTVKTHIANALGGDSFPAVRTIKIKDVDPKKDEFTLLFDLHVDNDNLKGRIDTIFKKMNSQEGQETQASGKQLGYDLHDVSEYHVIRSSGWIRRIYYKRTAVQNGTTHSNTYSIILKDQ